MREKKDNKNSTGNGRMLWKPGNMVYPVPAVMVTAADREGKSNIITIAWTGTVCTNPPMAYISVRPERYSYGMLKETGEFVINLTTEKLVRATDYCGVKSGRDTDKWKETGLTPIPAQEVNVPLIKESPVNIECRVSEIRELGSHHMFLARVVAVDVDEAYLNEQGRFELQKAAPIVYSHGEYYGLSSLLGTFGYSVRKKTVPARGNKKRPGGKSEK
ncbi:flavin reductase family protein [[Clostridium] symbiosum]|uniref:flavin reductase family protein n=1 Tax=Clostridium symbiosum TaxID=1512 RepID=UPI0019210D32|nr:flavin reductase family protein [[Clostridium] symbiosum]MDB2033109.1 flavin reductase family protein [[Clostridium] symbiosum]